MKVGSEREAASSPCRQVPEQVPGNPPPPNLDSGGSSSGANLSARKIDSFSIGNSRGGSPFLRPELALPRGDLRFCRTKKLPMEG